MLISMKRLNTFLKHINLCPENALICKINKSQINKIKQIRNLPSILHQGKDYFEEIIEFYLILY